MSYDFNALLEYARTEKQIEAVELCIEHGSISKAAIASGVRRENVRGHIKVVRSYAARKGYAPEKGMNTPTADGFQVKGTSTLYKDGEAVIQWVKTSQDAERQLELMKEAIDAFKQDLPKYKPIGKPVIKPVNKNLLNHITLTDTHIGDWASKESGGDTWNLKEAERVVFGVVKGLIDESPNAETVILSLLGDIVHYDSGLVAETPHSRNQLDSDGTMQTIAPIVVKILRRVVNYLLETHNKVVISIVRGNHDESSTVWLKAFLEAVYEDEKRIEFVNGDLFYQCYQVGKIMLGFHHGDKRKPEQLPLLFASRYPVEWGDSTKRFFHSGDKHHKYTRDVQGNQVIQHTTMDGKNRYSHNGGYDSERAADRYTYDINYGCIGTGHFSVDRLLN